MELTIEHGPFGWAVKEEKTGKGICSNGKPYGYYHKTFEKANKDAIKVLKKQNK